MIQMNNRNKFWQCLTPLVVSVSVLLLTQCAQVPSGAALGGTGNRSYVGFGAEATAESRSSLSPSAVAQVPSASDSARTKRTRPGLGTGWGDEVDSPLSYDKFERGSKTPQGIATIYYNDKEGVSAMTDGYYWKDGKMKRAANNLVEWGVKGQLGYYNSYRADGKRFVIGKKGRSYALVVRNVCDSRLEIVLSVDGVDVIDGQPASLRKRGYIIDPGATLSVEGFRTSENAVAAFRFSSVGASYTNMRHGSTRNVGVIGLAVYGEKGVDPWRWSQSELNNRANARAFAEAPAVRGR